MISQPDRGWCPDCRTDRHGFRTEDGECKVCGADVVDNWPLRARVGRRAAQVFTAVIGVAVLLGPPAWAVWRAVTYEGPLYATRTVTTTRVDHYGLVPDVGGALIPWLALLVMIIAIGGSGIMPRGL